MPDFMSIPIIRLKDNLIVSIQVALHDQLVLKLQEDVTTTIMKNNVRGLVIDVGAIDVMDSFIARSLNDIGTNARTMGVETVVVGLQPAVAITLIEMGMELDSVHTALNLDMGIEMLEKLRRDEEARRMGEGR
jgi:rsbT antagonist protein RsbS